MALRHPRIQLWGRGIEAPKDTIVGAWHGGTQGYNCGGVALGTALALQKSVLCLCVQALDLLCMSPAQNVAMTTSGINFRATSREDTHLGMGGTNL